MRVFFKLYIFKLVILSLTMIFFTFGASAINIGDMYKNCKPYQNNGYKIEGLTETQAIESVACNAYFRALINTGVKNCQILNNELMQEGISNNNLLALGIVTANSNANIEIGRAHV